MCSLLEFTAGSPFARAIRILLDELGLEYRRIELGLAPSADRRTDFPTLQVPALRDGG
ncbi:MAG: glutathione S-transferase N-terminal domain-containing protein [Rhizobiaceae bacterium]|nr:glutathione S-transferase N-terminal domain-containing protein [Rhizobiaceae bacterium]